MQPSRNLKSASRNVGWRGRWAKPPWRKKAKEKPSKNKRVCLCVESVVQRYRWRAVEVVVGQGSKSVWFCNRAAFLRSPAKRHTPLADITELAQPHLFPANTQAHSLTKTAAQERLQVFGRACIVAITLPSKATIYNICNPFAFICDAIKIPKRHPNRMQPVINECSNEERTHRTAVVVVKKRKKRQRPENARLPAKNGRNPKRRHSLIAILNLMKRHHRQNALRWPSLDAWFLPTGGRSTSTSWGLRDSPDHPVGPIPQPLRK